MKLFNRDSKVTKALMIKGSFLTAKPEGFTESFSFDFISYKSYKSRLVRDGLVLSPETEQEESVLKSFNISFKAKEGNTSKSKAKVETKKVEEPVVEEKVEETTPPAE